MKLGFASAILPDLSLEEVAAFAAAEGFDCVEMMCWPKGKAERRYAGVTHIDVTGFDTAEADRVKAVMAGAGVEISALGYYPNPLAPDPDEAAVAVSHIKRVIEAAALLGLGTVNTFVGRDWTKSVDENWPRFEAVWPPLVAFAEEHGVRIGIENCPMFFTKDEWPGGKNLATTPTIWRRMWERIPSASFGLNYDPSHFVWQHIDYIRFIHDFRDRIFSVHAQDMDLDEEMAYFTSRADEDFYAQVVDYGNDYPNREPKSLGEVSYAQLKSGKINVNGKEVPTFPISSYSRAVLIATTLKEWITSGKFQMTNPVEALPGIGAGIKMNTLEERTLESA